MKKAFLLSILFLLIISYSFGQEDKSKRISPPATVSQNTNFEALITIDYGQPGLKGRDIGSEVAFYGKVWRTGANEATTFEVDKDVTIEGQAVPAGKYSLYSIPSANNWIIIFNKVYDQWGTIYNQTQDLIRISGKVDVTEDIQEKLLFKINKSGKVSFGWGNKEVSFNVNKGDKSKE